MKKTIYVIAGPTATGKSDFSITLAKKLNGVVINSDSMQVYKNLKILTARPSSSETKNIPHYLYGYIDGRGGQSWGYQEADRAYAQRGAWQF